MKKITIYLIVFVCSLSISCKDFLREFSQNDAYIEETADLDELLAGEGYLFRSTNFTSQGINIKAFNVKDMLSYIHVLDDDIMENIVEYEDNVANSTGVYSQLYNFYRWSNDPYKDNHGNEIEDPYWKDFYYRIAVLNAILVGADELEEKGKSISELSRIRGETLFLRAWNYFMLVNIYGQPYDKKNPNDPYGIPLKIVSEIIDTDFKRNTVGEVYDQIVKDLNDAVEHFSKYEKLVAHDVYTPDKFAVYALLSRIYLYMEEYEKVIDIADKVVGFPLQDLKYLKSINLSLARVEATESIFTMGSPIWHLLQAAEGENRKVQILVPDPVTGIPTPVEVDRITNQTHAYAVSDDLANLFDENDLRYRVFFRRGEVTGNLFCRKFQIHAPSSKKEYDPVSHELVSNSSLIVFPAGSSCWLRYTEVLLNKMEAQACLGDAAVHSVLNNFLSSRYEIVPVTPSSGMELISFIRTERRKELCFEGHRWFDIRRYAVSSFPEKIEIEHKCFDVVENVDNSRVVRNVGTRTLKAYDENTKGLWVIPIPTYVREDNNWAITNSPRTSGVESNLN